jgi:hypothetical protein
MKRKAGEVREDGYIFRCYQRGRNGKIYEQWESPEAKNTRRLRQQVWEQNSRAKVKADPERLKHSREYAKLHQRRMRAEKPKQQMLIRARVRAKERGLPINITEDDFDIPAICPVLGIPLRVAQGVADSNSPELDRIVPELGYVKGNVIVISRRANRIKTDATIEELQKVASFFVSLVQKG